MKEQRYLYKFFLRSLLIITCLLPMAYSPAYADADAPTVNATVQPPCGEAEFNTAFNTVSGNSADSGGGIHVYNGTITLKNTAIDNNIARTSDNCYRLSDPTANINSIGFNLSSDTSCSGYLTQASDKNNVAAQLGPFANNGGPTLTHMPLAGSLLIDGGQCPAGTDQRGQPRPAGAACDIGAVERQPGDAGVFLNLPVIFR